MFDWNIAKKDRKNAMALIGLYENPSDPLGIQRVNGGSHADSFFHSMPNIHMFANILQWQFKTAYDVNATNVWTLVNTGSGTPLVCVDGRGGWAKSVNAASDNDYYAYSAKYSNGTLKASKLTWFQTEILIKTVAKADMFVGLMTPAATTGIFDARVDGIGFYLDAGGDGDGLLRCETTKTSTPTDSSTGVTLADGVSVKLGFVAVGTTAVYFYVNDSYVKTHTTNIPTANLAVAFGCRNGEGAANEFSINTINLGMER